MITINRVFRDTPTTTLVGAKAAKVITHATSPETDIYHRNRPYVNILATLRRAPPIGTGKLRKVHLKIYDKQDQSAEIWASCSCEGFLYFSEISWSLKGSSSVIYSNGKLPHIRNPNFTLRGCPHVVALLSWSLRSKTVARRIKQAQELSAELKRKR
jgi:hypothetical protein